MTVQERVARGAALLDERVPGWEARVVPEFLDMRSACKCVLGQVYGMYREAAVGLFGGDPQWVDASHESALEHGFNDEPYGNFDELEREWRSLIESRRAAS